MIIIEERKACKLPTATSLFFTLPFYDKHTFDILKQSENSVFNKNDNSFEFTVNSLCFLVELLCQFDDVRVVPFKDNIENKQTCDGYNFKVKPFQHQLDAVNFGLNHDGWLLLDDQGLGKTGTMIYLSEVLHSMQGLKHCLIICGVNSLKFNWVREIEKFSSLSSMILGQYTTKNGRIHIGSVADRLADLKRPIDEFFVITNIETLQSKDFISAFNNSPNDFGMIVLDEAHRCKNPSSLSVKTLLKIKADRCVALTGTAIVNDPENAYVPLKWTGNTKANFTMFKHMFNVYGGFGNKQVLGHKNLDLLKELLSTCSLRRLKSEVLDLPDKTYIREYVELGDSQRKLYEDVAKGIADDLNKLDHKPTIMEEMTINLRLRQITAFPGMLSSEPIPSAKLDRLEELVQDIVAQGDKVVVYSNFKDTVYEVKRRLDEFGVISCTGDDSDAYTMEAINEFQTNLDKKVFVCTWQKIGTGHTLTAACYAIFIDTPWTYASFEQACDRIYRIGQDKKVFIITLIANDTFDERVQEILNRKEDLSKHIVDNGDSGVLRIFS